MRRMDRKQAGMSRRALTLGALAGGASLALRMSSHAADESGSASTLLDVHLFGAKGDGKSVDTEAIQAAILRDARSHASVATAST